MSGEEPQRPAGEGIAPTSPFPFSPLTDRVVQGREELRAGNIAGLVVEVDAGWFTSPSATATGILQDFIDYRRSSDVRCGYTRPGSPEDLEQRGAA